MKQISGLKIPDSLADVCDPQSLALVIYDMQIGITKQVKDSARIIEQALRVLDAARSAGVRVFFMRHMSLPKPLMGVF
jgi:nicotinamidase-related amidase